MVRNAEGKSVVDVARLMNAVTITYNNNTTTSSNGVTVGAILFMVLMAAGLDPMTETRIADKTPESMHSKNKRYESVLAVFCSLCVVLKSNLHQIHCHTRTAAKTRQKKYRCLTAPHPIQKKQNHCS